LDREFRDEDVTRVFGKRNREILRSLIGDDVPAEQLAEYARRKEELYRGIMAPDLRPVPGLPEFLRSLRDSGINTAVATGGPSENVRLVLHGSRFEDAFDTIVTGPEVRESKPHPAIFLLAANRLGLGPADCVVFEDSPAGIQAGKAAGSRCIALATTHTTDELRQYQPDRIIKDFTELTVAEL